MKAILNALFEHQTLSEKDAYDVLTNIGEGAYNPSQISAFLTVFMMRNIAVEELRGFQNALLDLCVKVDFSDFETIDVCGTGGDGKDTFNISTLSALVIAGAGYKVAKHGNYSVSSSCGSSDVMEYLGYYFTNDESTLQKQLDDSNFCLMHAPLFHPALKNVVPIRRELGIKTFFNMLGPLVNPSDPTNQLVGVFNLEIARLYQYLFQDSKKKFTIIHSLDGYDEISLTGEFKMISNKGEKISDPQNLGFNHLKQSDIYGGNTVKEAADIFLNVLNNKATVAQKEVVLANAAHGIQCMSPNKSIDECKEIANTSIESGNALKTLKKVIA